jgi:alpha-maltose-1-phosphate synthase
VHTSDYCHLFTYQAARAKRDGGYKLVAIHYDNIPFSRDGKPLVRYTKQVIFGGVDAFFAMSERARQALLLEGVPAQKIFVIGNAIDVEKFRPRPQEKISWRQRYGIRENDIVVLFIGRVRASKGVFELAYATKKLLQDHDINASALRVVIIGRGPGEDELRKRINQLGLEKHVLLAGPVSHSEIHLAHNMADIFVLPSIPRKYWQEQFGIVLIESMACQKAVVSTLSGSIPDVVGEAGMLVQPNDHFALYLGLKKLLLDNELRADYGARARERVEQCFAQSVIAAKIRNAYHQVLARGN